jgi:hypothetical protein
VADDRPLHEVLLDYALYAPIGFVITAAEELPKLSELGRSRVDSRVKVARVVGKLAVRQLQRRLGGRPAQPATPVGQERLKDAPGPSATPVSGDDLVADPGAPAGVATPAARHASSNGSAPSVPEGPAAGRADPDPGLTRADELAIPGYDTLAASQVVQRLSSLEPDELEAVRRYEAATRGRRTILHRVAQLAAADGRASA